MRECSTIRRSATSSTFTLSVAQVQAAPIAPPGELPGVDSGAPLGPGVYLLDTAAYGRQTGSDGAQAGYTIPILIGSPPWAVLGGHIEPSMSQPNVLADKVGTGPARAGLFNTPVGVSIGWKLGPHLWLSYLLGVYLPSRTTIASASGGTRRDFALSYGDDRYSLTTHLLYGTIFEPVATFSNGAAQRNVDYLNIEPTAMRMIDTFECGSVAFSSTDLPVSTSYVRAGYARSGQFAPGVIAGHDFGRASLQTDLARDVAQCGCGGSDTRGWAPIMVAFGGAYTRSALPSRVVEAMSPPAPSIAGGSTMPRKEPTDRTGPGLDGAQAPLSQAIVLTIARYLHLNGQATDDTIHAVHRLGRRLGFNDVLLAGWDRVELLTAGEGRPTTVAVREVEPVAMNVARVSAVMAQVEAVIAGEVRLEALQTGVDAAARLTLPSIWAFAAAAGTGAGALAVIFGETRPFALAAIAAVAGLGGLARQLLGRRGAGLLSQDAGRGLHRRARGGLERKGRAGDEP